MVNGELGESGELAECTEEGQAQGKARVGFLYDLLGALVGVYG